MQKKPNYKALAVCLMLGGLVSIIYGIIMISSFSGAKIYSRSDSEKLSIGMALSIVLIVSGGLEFFGGCFCAYKASQKSIHSQNVGNGYFSQFIHVIKPNNQNINHGSMQNEIYYMSRNDIPQYPEAYKQEYNMNYNSYDQYNPLPNNTVPQNIVHNSNCINNPGGVDGVTANTTEKYVSTKPQIGFWICHNCGKENAEYVGTCGCGEVNPNKKTDVRVGEPNIDNKKGQIKFCFSCGESIEPGQMFCGNCGTKLDI